jgi:glycosyltransferase involved in cell wall biosynthesis
MKIAMFGIKGMPVPAGAENVAEQVGSRLVQRGHQVTVYVRPHYTPYTLKEYKGMRLVHLPSIPTKNLDAIMHGFLASLAVLGSGADIVHVHSTGNSIFALLPRLRGMKTIVQSHGLDWQRAKWGRFAKMYLKLTNYSTVHFPNATTAVSQKMTNFYQMLSGKQVIYIPNGVDVFESVKPDLIRTYGLQGKDYIFFAARFVPEKGAHYLIEAFKKINSDKKLVLAGDGSYGDPYAEELKKNASDNIIFPGFVQGRLLQEFLSNAYLYVLPSEIEGLSTGLLEAMSYGNCVLVSDIEENFEAIGEAGLTFQSKNVQALESQLYYAFSNPDLVEMYGARARARVQSKFNWENVTDQFEHLYQAVAQNQSSAKREKHL